MVAWLIILGFGILGAQSLKEKSNGPRLPKVDTLNLGLCRIILNDECPRSDIKYFLFTRKHATEPEEVYIGAKEGATNLSSTAFHPKHPIKIIIHGYNSGIFLNALVAIKNQYLKKADMNIFSVDWSTLAQAPCYPGAVWNARIVGKCAGLLVRRLREETETPVHVIGFSLGAHVAGFLGTSLLPNKVARITGLDPAMPGFSVIGNSGKLDFSDAEFVDIIHTNAFFQGHFQETGHVDFFVNGGVVQPGCWADNRFFSCNHHRAPFYFAESIDSPKGFWGWPCPNYYQFLLNSCPPKKPQILMGEDINETSRGTYLVLTDSVPPFAVGEFTGPTIDIKHQENEENGENEESLPSEESGENDEEEVEEGEDDYNSLSDRFFENINCDNVFRNSSCKNSVNITDYFRDVFPDSLFGFL